MRLFIFEEGFETEAVDILKNSGRRASRQNGKRGMRGPADGAGYTRAFENGNSDDERRHETLKNGSKQPFSLPSPQ